MLKPGSGEHFGQGLEGVAVEVVDPLGLVRDDQGALAQGVLGGDAGGAFVGVAALGLDAADGEHEAARGVGPVGADGQDAGDVEGADDLAAGAELDLVPQVQAHQGVVHEQQALAQRHADVVGEFHWRRARAAFLAVDHDEIGEDSGFQHGLGDAHEFPGMAQAEFEAHRFATGQFAQLLDELHQFDRRGKRAVA